MHADHDEPRHSRLGRPRRLRGPRRGGASVALALTLASCASLGDLQPDAHVVPAPVSARANVVLRNLITGYGSEAGAWGGSMSPGCAEVWATQFGYRAGVRRGRDDLVALGEATAVHEAAALRSLAWSALFGDDVDPDDTAVSGFPALLVSGTLGDRDLDAVLFESVLERALQRRGALDARQGAGLAAVLAAAAAISPERRDERLAAARELAETVADGGGGTWGLLAWAAIADATRREDDLERALRALERVDVAFDERGDLVTPLPRGLEVLSRLLSLTHGLADLARVTEGPRTHRQASSVLAHVFSDAWFDGRLLIHDRLSGPSQDACSGCNFMALYLVDRLHGDSFVIEALPAFPEVVPASAERAPRDTPEPRATVLFLAPEADGSPGRLATRLDDVGLENAVTFRHASEPVWIDVRFALGELGGAPAIHATVRSDFGGGETQGRLSTGFDGQGTARLRLGAAPLVVRLDFRREEHGGLSLGIVLAESEEAAAGP